MPSRMHISEWGPNFWAALHTSSFAYPRFGASADEPTQRDVDAMFNFLHSISGVLPCKKCCAHFADFLREKQPVMGDVLSSREALARFVVEAHNAVNRRQQPPKPEWTYEQALEYWTVEGRGDPEEGSCPVFTHRVRTRSGGSPCEFNTSWALALLVVAAVGAGAFMLGRSYKLEAHGRGRKVRTTLRTAK